MPAVSIFKAYDIRGTVPDQLDVDLAYRVGRATAQFLSASPIVVGRDARPSSNELTEALQRGLLDEGVDVIDLGLISTPLLYFAVDHLNAAGGIVVTASHNPAQYNGFKICREHAIPIGGDTGLKEIEASCERLGPVSEGARGTLQQRELHDAYWQQVKSVGGRCAPLKVAIDCGNGMGSVGLDRLMQEFPLTVEELYFEPDGTFPNHEADPLKDENLQDLIAAVKRSRADLGVAFDGDGDRAIFVDEHGEIISADLITALLAQVQLRQKPNGLVLYDLRSSRVTAESVVEAGGRAEMCRVGHSFVKAQMRDCGADFRW